MKQSGQVLVLLLLSTMVALVIGLSLAQSSLTSVVNSTRIDSSAKALSAAESGIEQALTATNTTAVTDLPNSATAAVSSTLEPQIPSDPNTLQTVFEYLPEDLTSGYDKADFAQYWLADPANPTTDYYKNSTLNVYFGTSCDPSTPDSCPALELNVVSFLSGKYTNHRIYLDYLNSRSNQFHICGGSDGEILSSQKSVSVVTTTSNGTSKTFLCKANVNIKSGVDPSSIPVMVRARILYTNTPQAIAVGSDTLGKYIPPQVGFYTSTGTSGQTKRRLQLTVQKNVVPFYFDFAIFSAAQLQK